ncbi:MAG TPA: heterodisulfide reductase-related iron-sulfur binding cluster, partial [Gammaproteobacteria bacterium]|nr:heterodisulfide reductase-related iron-sulfur binding cluster [Gammaproteobacteria bacterium]
MAEEIVAPGGDLKAPYRHPLDWKNPEFWDEKALYAEMERQFDICHTCRRCFPLCHSFPTLFDLIDNSETLELDSVPREAYWKVVDQCYLCDLCFMTKCPYTPPHEFDMDFPHLMLRAKAVRTKNRGAKLRDKVLTSTDAVGRIAGVPVVSQTVNLANKTSPARFALEKTLGVDRRAKLPEYDARSARRRLAKHQPLAGEAQTAGKTCGRVAIYTTCYCEHSAPALIEDLVVVFEHNGIPTRLVTEERCCGMPKMELGDLAAIEKLKNYNVPRLAKIANEGWDLLAPIPSCVLMYKQELPMIYPGDDSVARVKEAFFDPFEYLMLRHGAGLLNTDFRSPLGKVVCHASCHQRVQNIGAKTRDLLALVPGTTVELIQRCSGHDGTYAVKRETYDNAMKIGRPVFRRIVEAAPDYYGSD